MQASIWLGLEDTLETIVSRSPRSVLDVGTGFGAWGFLLRQYLDVWNGRLRREHWRVRIDGVEIDESRALPHARYLYDEILIGRAEDIVPARVAVIEYDTVIFGDVLEHIAKDRSLALLHDAVAATRGSVIVRIPLGKGWRTDAPEAPDCHVSLWEPDDFAGFDRELRLYDYHGRSYGFVTIAGERAVRTSLDAVDARLSDLERRVAALVEHESPREVLA